MAWWMDGGGGIRGRIIAIALLCANFYVPSSNDEEEEEDDVMRLPSFVVSVVGRSFGGTGTYRDRQAGGELGMGITYGAARAAATTTTVQNFTLWIVRDR